MVVTCMFYMNINLTTPFNEALFGLIQVISKTYIEKHRKQLITWSGHALDQVFSNRSSSKWPKEQYFGTTVHCLGNPYSCSTYYDSICQSMCFYNQGVVSDCTRRVTKYIFILRDAVPTVTLKSAGTYGRKKEKNIWFLSTKVYQG